MNEKDTNRVSMTYADMKNYFRTDERAGQHLTGYIIFSPASFTREYSEESRTYVLSSDNKVFTSNTGGCSIYASALLTARITASGLSSIWPRSMEARTAGR